jgi:hypothetical protein
MTPAPVRHGLAGDVLEKLDIRVGTILAGMKQVRANPRKMRGIVPQDIHFDHGTADGILPVRGTPEPPAPDGTRAG